MTEKSLPSEPAEKIVDFIINTRCEDLPPDVIDFAKRDILDTVAIAIGGSASEGCPEAVNLVKGWGGARESTILVYGGKVPAPMAAFANDVMARALDMGDTHPEAAHIAEYELFPLLAVAEMKGGVTGKEFIAAYVVGHEIACRIGTASFAVSEGGLHGRHPCLGPFGATTAMSKLLGLDAKTTWNALGIYYAVSGAWDMQMYNEGTLMVRGHHAFVCEDAVNAVLLAQRGITGPKNIFSGKDGFFTQFYPWKNDPNLLTDELGEKWEITKTMLKPYSACKFTHTSISGVIDFVTKHNIKADDIESIECTVSRPAQLVIQPNDIRWNPKTMPECQFSLPYTVATAAVKQKVFLSDYTDKEMARADVRELMTKVKATVDDKLPVFTALVKITLKDGKEYSTRVDYPKGAPENPMTWDDITQKFYGCAAYSAKPIPQRNLDQVCEMVRNLEDASDVSGVMKLLSP